MVTGVNTALDPSRQSCQLQREGSLAFRDGTSSPLAPGRRHPNRPRKQRRRNASPDAQPVTPSTARRLRTKNGRADYARRKAIVEPAFGQMKVRQAAGRLRLRGLTGAEGEWTLHVICHNLRKLAAASTPAPLGAA